MGRRINNSCQRKQLSLQLKRWVSTNGWKGNLPPSSWLLTILMLWKARVKDSIVGRLLSRYSLLQRWTGRGFLLQMCVSVQVKCIAYIQVLHTYSSESLEKIYIFIIFPGTHYHMLMILYACPFMTPDGHQGSLDEGYTLPHSVCW